ncbi:hypothetical protein AB1L05_07815 [Cytobacillus horneckiae]|uniref:hypothetical protein n=1 Tax=Cytobacillus horneckiae TaxID=549687 RepID=UPI0039A2EB9F
MIIFGLSPLEVGNLTYLEYSVMMERYNEKMKNDYEMQRNVIFNAIINANRKKNSSMIPLFKDNSEKTATEIIEEREELFG